MVDVKQEVKKYLSEMVDIRRQIHQHPELSMQEYKTTQLVKDKLVEYGVEIEECGLEVGVSGLIRGGKPGKTIAIRADMDALPMTELSGLPFASQNPEACHSCGHDIHTTFLLFCARILAEHKAELAGNVRLIFQPAEEKGTGAAYMIEHGVLSREPKPVEILGVHVGGNIPAGKVGMTKGAANASSSSIKIVVKGMGGHGARPHNCVDPVVVACYLVAQLQTIVSREVNAFDPAVLTFGTINGGTAFNVIPNEVTITGTLRTFSEACKFKVSDAIERTCKYHCESMNAKCEVEIEHSIPSLSHDVKIMEGLEKAAKATIGEDNIVWQENPSSGSEDFAFYLEHIPGGRLRLGTRNDDPATQISNHNPAIVFDESAIETGTEVILQYVFDALA